MTCRLCRRFWALFWERCDAWERARSNDSELWFQDTDRNRERMEEASALRKADPAAALRLYLEAADAGSAWASEAVAWHYDSGSGVEADFEKAQEYYRRAIDGGSWMATIGYARLLAEHGHHDLCERLLEDGVSSQFEPAYFWLAWLRYERSESREACWEVRPMMELAASHGHPGANFYLAQWMTTGRFGLREIWRGFRLHLKSASRWGREQAEEADAREASSAVDIQPSSAAGRP